jgi:hypothetical protein
MEGAGASGLGLAALIQAAANEAPMERNSQVQRPPMLCHNLVETGSRDVSIGVIPAFLVGSLELEIAGRDVDVLHSSPPESRLWGLYIKIPRISNRQD